MRNLTGMGLVILAAIILICTVYNILNSEYAQVTKVEYQGRSIPFEQRGDEIIVQDKDLTD